MLYPLRYVLSSFLAYMRKSPAVRRLYNRDYRMQTYTHHTIFYTSFKSIQTSWYESLRQVPRHYISVNLKLVFIFVIIGAVEDVH